MLRWLLWEPGGRLVMRRPATGTQGGTTGPASQPSCATQAIGLPSGLPWVSWGTKWAVALRPRMACPGTGAPLAFRAHKVMRR